MVFFSDFRVLENFASRCRFPGVVAFCLTVGGAPGQLPGSGPVDPNGTLFELLLEPLRGKPLLGKNPAAEYNIPKVLTAVHATPIQLSKVLCDNPCSLVAL